MSVLLALLVLQSETLSTDHFEVATDCRDRAFVKQVADTLEAGFAAMAAEWKDALSDKKRFRINLFSKPADYHEKDRELNGGKFATNWAFSHPDTGESYLVVQPRQGVPLMDRTKVLLLHEAFHLVGYRHAPRNGEAPGWLQEGLCERTAELGLQEALTSNLKFAHAVNRVRTLVAARQHLPLDQVLDKESSDFARWNDTELWYAEAWLLVKYLAERRPEDWKKFRETFRTEGAEAKLKMAAAVRRQLMDQVGGSVADLEKEWVAWVHTLKSAPWWRIAGDWKLTPNGVEGVAFPDQSAYLLSDGTLKSNRYRVRAEAQLDKLGFGQVDLVVMPSSEGQDAGNLLKVSVLRSGEASLLIRQEGNWSTVANARVGSFFDDPAAWVRLEMQVDDGKVVLRVAGKVVLEHTNKDGLEKFHNIRWGVGNFDSWTRFRALEARKD